MHEAITNVTASSSNANQWLAAESKETAEVKQRSRAKHESI